MKFQIKVTFLISGEIHDPNFSVENVCKKIDIKVQPWLSYNKDLWPYSREPLPLTRKYTIESIKRISD